MKEETFESVCAECLSIAPLVDGRVFGLSAYDVRGGGCIVGTEAKAPEDGKSHDGCGVSKRPMLDGGMLEAAINWRIELRKLANKKLEEADRLRAILRGAGE